MIGKFPILPSGYYMDVLWTPSICIPLFSLTVILSAQTLSYEDMFQRDLRQPLINLGAQNSLLLLDGPISSSLAWMVNTHKAFLTYDKRK